MLVYDDMQPSEKIRVYDCGVRVTTQEGAYNNLIDYRQGDMWAPKVELREALSAECQHFVECIRFKKVPQSSGESGLAVVRLLEASTKSLAEGGKRIPV